MAGRGRLISPKPWDRIDMNFSTPIGAAVTATADEVVEIVKFCDKSCIRFVEALNGCLIGSKPWNRNAWT